MSEGPKPGPQTPSQAPGAPAPREYRGRGGCSCGRCRMRGLWGPVLLISVGTLFLIPQFIPRLDFGDLWPVLLIVIGVMKLLQSTASIDGHQG